MQVQYKRDEHTGFLTNNNDAQYQQILQRRQQIKERKEIESRLTVVENQLTAIRDVLQILLSGK